MYKLCKGVIYLDSRACGLRHATVESQWLVLVWVLLCVWFWEFLWVMGWNCERPSWYYKIREPNGLGFPIAYKERFRVNWTREKGTGGIDGISPRAQALILYNYRNALTLVFRSFFNKQPIGSHHLHLKSSISAKLNHKPILDSYPMHLNNFLLRWDLLSTVCTHPSLTFFSGRRWIWLQQWGRSVDRVSFTPKPLPVNLGDHVGVPLCNK